jgi:hypothetical protein
MRILWGVILSLVCYNKPSRRKKPVRRRVRPRSFVEGKRGKASIVE